MDRLSKAVLKLASENSDFRRALWSEMRQAASRTPGNESKGPKEEDEEDEGWDPGEVISGEKPQNDPQRHTAGKKERRSIKDKKRSDKMKGNRKTEPKSQDKKKGPKSQEQKKRDKETRERQVEKGKFGLPGAGRGGKHESKKDKAKRPDRKQKHKGRSVAASLVRDALLEVRTLLASAPMTKRQILTVQRRHKLPGKVEGRGKNWTVEVKNDRDKRAWEKALGFGLGGYVTGYGSWMLSPSYQSSGDWNDPSSRHHY